LLDRRRRGNIHAIVGFSVSALALDAMPPSEKTLVMVGCGLRLFTDDRVARLVIAERGGHHRGRSG